MLNVLGLLFSFEEWFAEHEFRKDTSYRPDIN